MPRYIDADALIDFLDVGHLRHPSELFFSEVDVANLLLHAPTISPDEVRGVGHWVTEKEAIDADDYSIRDTCSVCGHCDWDCTESASFKYCPNCGAKMEVTDDA